MEISPNIFRNYDIRGIVPQELNAEVALHIGKALGTILIRNGGRKVVVGRDNRKSSEELKNNLISGLISTGCSITDIGISLTPIIHFLTATADFDLGIEVTASHNPKNYNGFRIDSRNAIPFYGEDIQQVKALIKDEDYESGTGLIEEKDLFPSYLAYLKEKFNFDTPIRVVVDCGNGTSSYFAPKILTELGCDVVPMYCTPDPEFPHGIPDPEDKEIMEALIQKVKDSDADLGVIFDPDSDRFGFVDEKGKNYDNDKTLMLFADDVLGRNPGATVVFDVKCTGLLEDFIISRGGVPKRIRTGHPYFVKEIKEGAILGAEFSGHTYYAEDYFGYDDGIFAACKLIEKIVENKRPLSLLMLKYPMRVHSSEVKLSCPDDLKFGLIDTLIANFKELPDVLEIDETDGARIKVTPTGWFLIRASNTSPLLSVRVEGLYEKEALMMIERVKIVLTPFVFVDTSPLDSVKLYVS